MRKGEATRARILGEAGRQAAVRGVGAVSLGDVAEAVGLSKSGLFKHFDSKEAMQEALMTLTAERFVEFVWKPAEPLAPGRDRLEHIFDLWMDWDQVENAAGGCLIMSASVEFDDQPGPLRDLVHGMLARWHKRLQVEMQALCDPPLTEDAALIGVFEMNSFILGHHQSARLMGDANARAVARGAFRALLDRMTAAAQAGNAPRPSAYSLGEASAPR